MYVYVMRDLCQCLPPRYLDQVGLDTGEETVSEYTSMMTMTMMMMMMIVVVVVMVVMGRSMLSVL